MKRVDLAPEPDQGTDILPWQRGVIESGWMSSQASFARYEQAITVRVPAAGHLGVQEIQCGQHRHCGAQV